MCRNSRLSESCRSRIKIDSPISQPSFFSSLNSSGSSPPNVFEYSLSVPSSTTVRLSLLPFLILLISFLSVALSKNVSFQAFNKLAPGVTVLNPDFPGDAPNGIRLSLDSLVPSPSNLDIDLGDITFLASFDGQLSQYLSLLPKNSER